MTQLREYQTACLETVRERYKAGVRRQLVCLPTGTGKTVVFAQFPGFFRMKKRMLVLAHREELLDQACDKIRRANPNLSVAVEQAARRVPADTDVVVASVPTLGREHSRRLQALDPEQFYLVVVDEAHHATADTYRRVLEHFGLFAPGTARLLVGFTATPRRGDGVGLNAVFQEIVFSRSLPEMVAAGFLAPLAAYRVETDVDLTRVRTRLGDFVTSQLSEAVNVAERNALVVRVYRERLAGRQTLCFCVDVAHALSLAEEFRAQGIACTPVTGDMERAARAAALQDFAAGHTQVLTNCMVLTEGYDEASIAGIILARPTKSALLYTQMIGRGTRLHPGKKDVTVIDIVDVTRDQKLVSLPTLFGLPSGFDLEGRTTREVERAFDWVAANRPWVRADRAVSLSDLRYRCRKIDLFDLHTPGDVAVLTALAWIQTGENRYCLNLGHGERLVAAPNILGEWDLTLQQGGAEALLERTPDEAAAIHAGDRFVTRDRAAALPLVKRDIRWRYQPASEKQLRILGSLGLALPPQMTKGQASYLIGMLPGQRGPGADQRRPSSS